LQLCSFVDVRRFTPASAAPALTPEATVIAAQGHGTLRRELTGSRAEHRFSLVSQLIRAKRIREE
jgi:hypothetical protein